MKDEDPFIPGRPISGFKTGPYGMGHIVIHVKDVKSLIPFYTDILDFKISDYSNTPISLCFFHINGRHHSLALFGSGKIGSTTQKLQSIFEDIVSAKNNQYKDWLYQI